MSIFCDRPKKSKPDDLYLGQLAHDVIERAARDAANGSPTAGAWLLSDEADTWADAAGLDDGLLGELASKALERLA
jgi:hypothetical protein